MRSGGDGWDDPVPLPEDEDTVAAAPPPPAPAPLVAGPPAPVPPAPEPQPPSGGRSRRKPLLGAGAVGVVAIVAVAAVVGGGSSSHHHNAGVLTHAQLVAKADAICAANGPRLVADENSGDLAAGADVIEATAAKLAALKPPAADAAGFRGYVADVRSAGTAMRARDQSEFSDDSTRAESVASELGLTTCAGGSQTG